jgi:hypothetical protein
MNHGPSGAYRRGRKLSATRPTAAWDRTNQPYRFIARKGRLGLFHFNKCMSEKQILEVLRLFALKFIAPVVAHQFRIAPVPARNRW